MKTAVEMTIGEGEDKILLQFRRVRVNYEAYRFETEFERGFYSALIIARLWRDPVLRDPVLAPDVRVVYDVSFGDLVKDSADSRADAEALAAQYVHAAVIVKREFNGLGMETDAGFAVEHNSLAARRFRAQAEGE